MAELISKEIFKGSQLKACQNNSHLGFAFEFYMASKEYYWRENSSKIAENNHTKK